MTAQEPFHNFFSRTGRSPLRRVVLVALVDELDLLAEIVGFVSGGTLRDGLWLAGCHELILRRWKGGGNRRNRRRRQFIKSLVNQLEVATHHHPPLGRHEETSFRILRAFEWPVGPPRTVARHAVNPLELLW